MPENLRTFLCLKSTTATENITQRIIQKTSLRNMRICSYVKKRHMEKIISEKSSFSCLRVLISLQGSFNYTTQPFSVYIITMENKNKR